jgi:hypothetical protein
VPISAVLRAPSPVDKWLPCAAPTSIAIPEVALGQLWLVGLSGFNPQLPTATRRVVTAANVVIYDRALAPIVAVLLPPGGYAEPAADDAFERCIGFASDGWSVLRLLAGDDWNDRVGRLAVQLQATTARGKRVSLFAESDDGDCDSAQVALDRLAAAIGAHRRHDRLTIVIPAGSGATQLHAVAANGLAG